MVLFILAVVWAVYLVSWLRSRHETRNVNSISSFSRHLSVLERTSPGSRQGTDFGAARRQAGLAPLPPMGVVRRPTLSPAKKRRKDILTGLGATTGVLALAAVVFGGRFVALFVLVAAITAAYVALLVQTQKRVLEQRTKVRHLANPARPVAPRAWAQADDEWADGGWDDGSVEVDWTDQVEADGTYGAYRAPRLLHR